MACHMTWSCNRLSERLLSGRAIAPPTVVKKHRGAAVEGWNVSGGGVQSDCRCGMHCQVIMSFVQSIAQDIDEDPETGACQEQVTCAFAGP